jgi:acetyl-CoA C-acetyltransferase
MSLKGDAAIVGIAEFKPERRRQGPLRFTLEQWAELARLALDDAGLSPKDVDGICCTGIRESSMFAPSTIVEYLDRPVNFAEYLDLGGASSVGMVWRAAAAIELGICDVVLCVTTGEPTPPIPEGFPVRPVGFGYGASSGNWGSPQAEFDIPYGNLAQNNGYALAARRYGAVYGHDAEALAKIAVDQRTNACANPEAVFYGQPITIEDVLNSPVIADPLHMLEIVMPVAGGAAVVVASREVAQRTKHRPARVAGFGERVAFKTPSYAPDLLDTPLAPAAEMAFNMAGIQRADIDMASLYDCYTITVLLSLEDAGFAPRGEGAKFIRSHDLTYRGDFPLNTHGGQLSFGQAGMAGGMSHITEAVRQIGGRAGERQLPRCENVFVSGNGGILAEQSALILQGA